MTTLTFERRAFESEFQVRQNSDGSATLEGHAAVFNSLSRNLGGFVEQVHPDAFKQTLSNKPDVRALINHNPDAILGRTLAKPSPTLKLSTDSTGLAYKVDMPDRTDAKNLLVSVQRGDISQSSFGFYNVKGGEDWSETEQGYPLRTLLAVNLHHGDVSPVVYPAYEGTDTGARALRSLAAARGLPVELVMEAAARDRLRAVLAGELGEPDAGAEEEIERQAQERARRLLLMQRQDFRRP